MARQRFNWQIWAALLLSVAAFLSWPVLFVRWPITRDFPWANVLLWSAAVALGVNGLRRALAPGRRRALRMAVGAVVALVGCAILVQFVLMVFVAPRRLPASVAAPAIGDRAPNFTLPDANGQSVSLSDLLSRPMPSAVTASDQPRPPKAVLLLFYMYAGCRACNSEFRGVQQHLAQFANLGVRPVAISIDEPEVSRRLSEEAGYTFTFLSDPKLDVIRRYDLANKDGEARPAEFLLDSNGTVRWRNLTRNYYIRARPEQILQAAKDIR